MNQPQPLLIESAQIDFVRNEIEKAIEEYFSEYVGGNLLEIHFADIIVPPSTDAEKERRQTVVRELVNYMRTVPHDKVDIAYHCALRWRSRSESANLLVKDFTNGLLQSQILPLKNVCEAMLTSTDLKIENTKIWLETFEFMDNSISKLDYKGVRDVLKLLFDIIGSANCPVHIHCDQLHLHEIIEKLILRICDRKLNLLPAYFIINEIRKCYCEPKFFPHWRLAECFTKVVESFRPLGQIITITCRSHMLPVAAHSGFYSNTSWKLDLTTLKINVRGNVPMPNDVNQPQCYIIHQVLLQPSFKDLLNVFLCLQLKHNGRLQLDEIFGSTILEVMAETEKDGKPYRHTWRLLSSVFTFLISSYLLNFTKFVRHLHAKLSTLPYRKARDHLMLFLLQCSCVAGKAFGEEIPSILELYRILYSGSEEFFVSESDTSCVYKMSASCLWIYILDKVKEFKDSNVDANFLRLLKPTDLDIPPSINIQIKFLQDALKNKQHLSLDNFLFATLCNAYCSNKETFQSELLPVIFQYLESRTVAASAPSAPMQLPGNLLADSKCSPLKIDFLDSITYQVRMNIMAGLLDMLCKYLISKTTLHVSPAVVETYCRILCFSDIERPGLHQFFTRIVNGALPQQQKQPQGGVMLNSGAHETLHMVCEIISYRLQQMSVIYRAQCFHILQQAVSSPYFNMGNPQLYWMLESTMFRQMLWFPTLEIMQAPFMKVLTTSLGNPMKDGTRSFFAESEELSKITVLAMARAFVVSGPDGIADEGYRNLISQLASHSWPSSTLQFFPNQLSALYGGPLSLHPNASTNLSAKAQLKQLVEQDYIKTWRTANTDVNVEHFERSPAQKIFLCVVLRHLVESREVSQLAIKILQDIGPKNVSNQLSNLVDYILLDMNNTNVQQVLNRYVECLSQMVWKYAIVPLDRLVLTVILRPYDGNEAVYSVVIAYFLLQNEEFVNRVQEICNTLPADYWKCGSEWFEKHFSYHQKYPEKYWSAVLHEKLRISTVTSMPVYFGNACLAILPVLDLLLQRIIELPEATEKFFVKLLDSLGALYKFHPQPISFLFNTFRFYEKRLSTKVEMKQKLVFHIHTALAAVRGENWLVSGNFLQYLQSTEGGAGVEWISSLDYYAEVIKRLVDCLTQPLDAPQWVRMDWRFSEFPGPQSYALHAVCVELMALPCSPRDVGNSLLEVVLQCHSSLQRKDISKWLNALGLIFTGLPISYGEVLYDRLADALNDNELDYWVDDLSSKFDFEQQWSLVEDIFASRLMAIAHSVWLHASIGYLNVLPQKLRDPLKPLVRTEAQFVYMCHLVGPFLQRLHLERSKIVLDIAADIYDMLLKVDKNATGSDLKWEDTICDLLYHMKYMYVGDGVRGDTDRIIPQLRNSLQTKLRYIGHQQVEGSVQPPSVQSNI